MPAKFELVEDTQTDTVYLRITNVDGSFTQTNVTELMQEYIFNNSNEIAFTVNTDGYRKTVLASIRDNSIGLSKLSLEAISTIEGYVTSANNSARSAFESAENASFYATNSYNYSESSKSAYALSTQYAKQSESYAKGGTSARVGEDTDNAKYYMEQAKKFAQQAGGGTGDYPNLTNKPQINSVELNGNKTMEELGVLPLTNLELENLIEGVII